MHANFLYGKHAHSTGNETIAWQHLQIEHGGHDIALDFQVLTSIYFQKRFRVNLKSKRITAQCVWLIFHQNLLFEHFEAFCTNFLPELRSPPLSYTYTPLGQWHMVPDKELNSAILSSNSVHMFICRFQVEIIHIIKLEILKYAQF